ncbi:MAG: RluA family pseudouridine synthase [Clostridia bacterium]|nr:RluA family pseudouridine synthase [Clostridia bacterium]
MRADAAIAILAKNSGTDALTSLSRSGAARLIESGAAARADGTPLDKKTILKAGDAITVQLPEPVPTEAEPEDIPLDVVYEDEDVIVVNKPKGMVVHPAPGHEHGTLVSALLYRCGDSLSGIGGVLRPGIVHRIDRDTTGLIAAAKNDRAHVSLAAQLADHSMHRQYRAIVIGGIDTEGVIDAAIGRHPRDRKKMAVLPSGASGARDARTHYYPITDYGAFSEVRLILETGRTHQIRVHMSHIGHPVLGDEIYGANRTPFEKKHAALLTGQALHAETLTFTHPRTGEKMTFSAPPPKEYLKLIEILENM